MAFFGDETPENLTALCPGLGVCLSGAMRGQEFDGFSVFSETGSQVILSSMSSRSAMSMGLKFAVSSINGRLYPPPPALKRRMRCAIVLIRIFGLGTFSAAFLMRSLFKISSVVNLNGKKRNDFSELVNPFFRDKELLAFCLVRIKVGQTFLSARRLRACATPVKPINAYCGISS